MFGFKKRRGSREEGVVAAADVLLSGKDWQGRKMVAKEEQEWLECLGEGRQVGFREKKGGRRWIDGERESIDRREWGD